MDRRDLLKNAGLCVTALPFFLCKNKNVEAEEKRQILKEHPLIGKIEYVNLGGDFDLQTIGGHTPYSVYPVEYRLTIYGEKGEAIFYAFNVSKEEETEIINHLQGFLDNAQFIIENKDGVLGNGDAVVIGRTKFRMSSFQHFTNIEES